ncbi:type II toxin-antitoxin system VapC family toxin [uncultured Jatrophihabitans sp.]|uniref:type II toxin-antitoxin system VapC family toxin n=1 Tax=uncultured Jatrophihabitans sp. TaxID=1610747 RepID=UPI0035CAB655
MNYFDSSALLKLLFEEHESGQLAHWVAERSTIPSVSSELVKIEVVRAARRLDPQVLPAARRLVAQLDLIPMASDLIESAADVGSDLLRSLDAIHLASALSLGSALTAFVAYDTRLTAAAQHANLPIAQPGTG